MKVFFCLIKSRKTSPIHRYTTIYASNLELLSEDMNFLSIFCCNITLLQYFWRLFSLNSMTQFSPSTKRFTFAISDRLSLLPQIFFSSHSQPALDSISRRGCREISSQFPWAFVNSLGAHLRADHAQTDSPTRREVQEKVSLCQSANKQATFKRKREIPQLAE